MIRVFNKTICSLALPLLATLSAGAQVSMDCPPSEKHFGVAVDSTAPAGIMRLAAVGTGWGGSKAGLKPGDEILEVNNKAVPGTGAAAQTAFLNAQPVSDNSFKIRRAGTVQRLSVSKTCRPPGDAQAMAEFRRKLLQLIEEQRRNFTGVTGTTKLPAESIGRTVAYESTVHLFKDDYPMIKVEPKAEFSYYFNRIRSGMSEPVSARFFAIWQATLTQALPEYESTAAKPSAAIPNHSQFTKGTNPACEVTLSRTGYQGNYTVSIRVSGTKEPELDISDLLD